ncbi:MAG: beta-ketoacyl-[acyl-carrier-protein] synthase family protein [Bacteroidia bacterium]|nr:beta-ketoacyl-[acyl-carrier-protein] synthase family protein [Bacteroidia bacterium]
MNVYITGIGIISAIGFDVQENYYSLKEKKSGIGKLKFLPSDKDVLAGEVKLSDNALIRKCNLIHSPYSRTSLLGIAAATEAWGNNVLTDDLRTGIISATSVGGMDQTENYYRQVLEYGYADSSLIRTHDSGNTTEKIARQLGITGYINTLSTACSSGANAIMLGARMLEQNKIDRILVGGSDSLTQFTIKGFHSLMIYDGQWCKPFDENRNGLNLGEGAAFLLLENQNSIIKTKNNIYCRISGWHNAADAFHQTASSPEGKGATLAMKQALVKAGISPDDVSYINAHGTGTKNNDASESAALKNIFGNNIPAFSSTKAYTGHTLAAAGAIEAVYSVLAIQNDVVLPNINFTQPIAETELIPQTEFRKINNVNSVLSNSFGFGGNNTSLVFTKN